MRRLSMLSCLVLLSLAAPAAAGAQSLVPAPSVVTRTASPVATSTATVRGGVDPNGQPASYRFEYGTTTSYGYTTVEDSAGSGNSTVSVSAALDSLKPDTVYHYRVVAWPDASPNDVVDGADKTFHTSGPPGAATNSTLDVASDSATLSGKVDPNRAATSYYFQYGPTNQYGEQTPAVPVGQGSAILYEQVRIAGLTPNTTYHFRLVATNSAGTSVGQDRGFRTLRAPSGIVIGTPSLTVRYGRKGTITGQVQGTGVGGIRLALLSTPFPFTAPFTSTSTVVTARADGTFRFPTLPLWGATLFRVVTRTTPSVSSGDITARTTLIATVTPTLLDARRAQVAGTIRPRLVGTRASLQRQQGTRWITVKRTKTVATTPGHVGYAFVVARGTNVRTYRVVLTPRSHAYAKTITRTFGIAKKPKPHKKKKHH
jgi:hypothetical protein